MAEKIVKLVTTACGGDFMAQYVVEEVSKEILSATRPAPGYIRTSEGVDMRLLGEFQMTKDGAVCGNMFCDIWTIHRGTGKVYKTTPYHAGIRGGYSTEAAAEAAKREGEHG